MIVAFPQDLFQFLGGEMTSISATEYAIVVIVCHTFLLSTLGLLLVTREIRWLLDKPCSEKRTMVQPLFATPDRNAHSMPPESTQQDSKHGCVIPVPIAGMTRKV